MTSGIILQEQQPRGMILYGSGSEVGHGDHISIGIDVRNSSFETNPFLIIITSSIQSGTDIALVIVATIMLNNTNHVIQQLTTPGTLASPVEVTLDDSSAAGKLMMDIDNFRTQSGTTFQGFILSGNNIPFKVTLE